jgi:hypothetical protein
VFHVRSSRRIKISSASTVAAEVAVPATEREGAWGKYLARTVALEIYVTVFFGSNIRANP